MPVWSFAKRYWPIRTVEKTIPEFNHETWRLAIDGLVENTISLTFTEFKNLPFIEQTADLNCVESMWGYKSEKWVERIEFVESRHAGYWVQRGYDPDGGPKKFKTKD